MTVDPALVALVQGEDAAVYAYQVAGARVAGGGRRRALAGLDAHQANRDRAASLIVEAGGTPPGSAVAYRLPAPIDTPAAARSLMAQVDNSLVGLYADAAVGLSGKDRRWAARTASECAARAVAWGAAPQAFPTGPTPATTASASPSGQ